MNKKNYVAVLLIITILLLVSSCKKSGAATGSAPRDPFLGGTAGLTLSFEKGNPPEEVTDDQTFSFNTILMLKNEGEFKISKDNIRLNLEGFDPADFGQNFDDIREVQPEDDLEAKTRDAEGNIREGTTTFTTFPKDKNNFVPRKFQGNTEFTFRANACYNYQTLANTKLCVLKDMINIRDDSICKPSGSSKIFSSSGPVQVTNFKQYVVGKDKISFTFDVALSGNVDLFWDKNENKPTSFENGCPREPRIRRERENNVGIEIKEIPTDPIFKNLKCGGLNDGSKGVIKLVNGKRSVTCTVELVTDRLDLEKITQIQLDYNVLDNKETKVLIKHLT